MCDNVPYIIVNATGRVKSIRCTNGVVLSAKGCKEESKEPRLLNGCTVRSPTIQQSQSREISEADAARRTRDLIGETRKMHGKLFTCT